MHEGYQAISVLFTSISIQYTSCPISWGGEGRGERVIVVVVPIERSTIIFANPKHSIFWGDGGGGGGGGGEVQDARDKTIEL